MAIFSRNSSAYSRRLFFWLVAYSALLVVCVLAFQYNREQRFKSEELNAKLQTINAIVIDQISQSGNTDSVEILRNPPFKDLRISIINPDGKIIYDTALDSLPQSSHLSRKEIAAAIATGEGYATRRHSESTGGTYFYSARKGDGYIVRTAVPYSLSLRGLLKVDYGFIWFMVGITGVMCILGYFMTRKEGVNEEAEKSKIRRQLTNNINHELKTPLASIQACVETLASHPDLPQEKRDDFLHRCLANVTRLKHLLDDVGTITRLEDGKSQISKEPMDLGRLICDVCAEMNEAAENKGMLIHTRLKGDIVVNGNSQLLASVFQNLIDNAIAYSGGSEVTISNEDTSDGYHSILVADDGVGVDPKHLGHLFERFYRVDKGRSRKLGGTGLGLSIVKNSIAIHGGSVSVANRADGGLVFRISIPKF